MATDPYAAIRNLRLNEIPTTAEEMYAGFGDPAEMGYTYRPGKDSGDSTGPAYWARDIAGTPDYGVNFSPEQQAYQSKFNEIQMLPDGRMVATLQQPGAHKYDLMQAVYAKDPATGQWALQGDPSNFKQQSSKTSMLQGLGTGLATIGGMAVAGPLAGALGGGVLGAAGAGAVLGGAKPLLSGGNSNDIGKGIVRGGATGAVVGGIGEYMSTPAADLPSGMDLAADAGANGANSIGSAAAQFNTPDYSSGISNAAGQHAPLDDYYTGGGASDMSTGGQYAGQGGHPFAVGEGAGAEMLGMYPGSTTPFDPGETIEVTGKKPVAPTEPTGLPQADYSNEGRNYPTPESTQGPGGSPVNSSPVQAGIGSKIGDFFKANPRLAISLLGSVLGKAGGGSGNAPATGGTGGQGGMTATQAPKFQRQYVAPPAGYRPGFDPEHKYFTGIGTSGTGG